MGHIKDDTADRMKTIAVDLDDTLNNFTHTLQTTPFSHNTTYNIAPDTFADYLGLLRSGSTGTTGLLSTEYSFFCYKIHSECYDRATPRRGAVGFMQWLRSNQWRIVILTHRDLRRSNEPTRRWLRGNEIPFDYLFTTANKLKFCAEWKIEKLVDDHLANPGPGEDRAGVKVYYPIMQKHQSPESLQGEGFNDFEELKQWIQK
jgi:hypothetical protein